MSPTVDLQGRFGKIKIPPGWQKPCKASQWNDGVLVASSVALPNVYTTTNFDDIPISIAPDGAGGVFVLTACNLHLPGSQGPLALRPIGPTGKPAAEVRFGIGDPIGWIGVLGVWCEGVVVPSGTGRCIVVWGKDQHVVGPVAQRFDQMTNPLWPNPVPLTTITGYHGFQNAIVAEPDGQDGAIVAWILPNQLTAIHNAQIQRIDSNGNVIWGQNGTFVGSVKGKTIPVGQPWLQLVADGNGGAIVVMLQETGGNTNYVAQRIGANGALNGPPATLVASPVSNEWSGNIRVRRAVSDGAGGLFLAYADAQGKLSVLRYTAAGVVRTPVVFGTALNPAAFHIESDDSGGFLLTHISSSNQGLELIRVDGNLSTTWDINTAMGSVPMFLNIPFASSTFTVNDWSHIAHALPDGTGGTILVFRFWPNHVLARLRTCCFDSSGVMVSPEQEISARPGMQEHPIVTTGGGASAIVAWTDDNQATVNGLDVWAQRVGCCFPSPFVERPIPPFGCEIIQLPGMGFHEMRFHLPCGNRDLGWGVIPLTRFFSSIRGLDYPGSIFNRDVDPPDWIRIRFSGLPKGTEVKVFSMKGKLLAESILNKSDVSQCFLTFQPSAKDDQLLVFSNSKKIEKDTMLPVYVDSEWGVGKPPPLPKFRSFD